MSASEAWEQAAGAWADLVRGDGDAAYAWNGPAFLDLLPSARGLTVDIGCGEGRLDRELAARGYRVVALDSSPTLVRLAREAHPDGDYRVADAASLPLGDASAELAVAFMSLHDVEDMPGAVSEVARVLERGGRFCFAIVHPVATAGHFDDDDRFVIERPYLASFSQSFPLREASVPSFHRPLEAYSRALEAAGFLLESVRELPTRRRARGRIPMFLHVRAMKP